MDHGDQFGLGLGQAEVAHQVVRLATALGKGDRAPVRALAATQFQPLQPFVQPAARDRNPLQAVDEVGGHTTGSTRWFKAITYTASSTQDIAEVSEENVVI